MEALILAGGKGTRLQAITNGGQKVVVEIAGQPFLEILLSQLCAAGFRKVHLAVGYKADEVAEVIRRCDPDIEVNLVREEYSLGTGGAIRNAAQHVTDQHFLVLNGDSYNDIDYAELLTCHIQSSHPVSILTTWVPDASRYGTVELDKTGRIASFCEKSGIHDEGLISAGVYCFSSDALKQMDTEIFSIEDYFASNVDQQHLQSIISRGEFCDIGTPEDFKAFKLKMDRFHDHD